VTNRHVVTDRGAEATADDVHRDPILEIAAGADADGPDVAAHDGMEPQARLRPDDHVADHDRARDHVGAGIDDGMNVPETRDHAWGAA
jgi:hypothetical protein